MAALTYTCRVITEREAQGRTIIQMAFGQVTPAFIGVDEGEGDLTLLCGGCNRVLVQTVEPEVLTHIIIRCTCRAYNDTDLI